jgi:ABC-2 type transport system ATP-binding protein
MGEAAISTRDLTKVFGNFAAVDGVNLDIPEGELFGLLGPNGAGKTTLVRMLCTLLEPTRGTATIAGHDLRREAAEVRRRIGVVSDGVSLYRDLTVEENLRLLSTLYDLPKDKTDQRIGELLAMFNFREKARRLVSALSAGWVKRAMIVAALVHDPKILFLDEVTSGLDPQSAVALRRFTRDLCDSGVTVIWTTHYMQEPEMICDRVGIIFEGRLIQIGTPTELRQSVSEQTALEIETPNLDPEVVRKISSLEDVSRVTYDPPLLRVTCTNEGTGKIEEKVTRILMDSGARLRAINTKRPTLEEAFISLTGGEEEIERFIEKGRGKG